MPFLVKCMYSGSGCSIKCTIYRRQWFRYRYQCLVEEVKELGEEDHFKDSDSAYRAYGEMHHFEHVWTRIAMG